MPIDYKGGRVSQQIRAELMRSPHAHPCLTCPVIVQGGRACMIDHYDTVHPENGRSNPFPLTLVPGR